MVQRAVSLISLIVLSLALIASTTLAADAPNGSKAAARAIKLPAAVDLRPQFVELGLVPRKQAQRNTCSVFTTAAALEFALSRLLREGTPLSVEYLNWAANQATGQPSDGQFFHNALRGFELHGICSENAMPYQRRFDPKHEPDERSAKEAQQVLAKNLQVHWINPWKPEPGLTDDQLLEIKQVLASGWPVAAGSSHSRLLVGYVDDESQPGGGTFLTKDSGNGSFDSVTYEFVKSKVGDVFWVDAPLKAAAKKLPPRSRTRKKQSS